MPKNKSLGGRPRKEGLRPRLKKGRKGKYSWYVIGHFPGDDKRIDRSLGIEEPQPEHESMRQEAVDKIKMLVDKAQEISPELGKVPVIDEKSGEAFKRPDRVTVGWVCEMYAQFSKDDLAQNYRMKPLIKHLGDIEITDIKASTGSYYYHQRQKDKTSPPSAGEDAIVYGASRATVVKDISNYYTALRWVSRDHRFSWILEAENIDVHELCKSYKLRMLAPSMKEVSEIELNRKSQRIDRPDGERPMTLDDFYEIFDASAPHVQIYLMLATLCGARKGAILDLTWDRVSLNPDDPY